MAKKKSKGFIVPSINFITMHRPAVPDEVAAGPIESLAATPREPEAKTPTVDQGKPAKPKVVKPAPLEMHSNGRKKSALSLSSLRRNKQEQEELKQKRASEKKEQNLPQDPFTADTFQKVWQDYIDGLHQKGEKILASILMADKPVLKGQMIHVTYPNQLMKKELLRVRPKVLKHIRKALNNHAVDFVIEVKEEHEKRFAYTPQEKYELLKEKNSAISILRKTFNLEL